MKALLMLPISVRLIAAVAAATFALFLLVSPSAAHEPTSVTVEPNTAHPGEEITVRGEGFEDSVEVEITLEGVRGMIHLGEATVQDGDFSVNLSVPQDVRPGSYQLRASGEESAGIDFAVLEPTSEAQEPTVHTDEEETVSHNRPPALLSVLGVVLAVGAIIGVLLVRAGSGDTTPRN